MRVVHRRRKVLNIARGWGVGGGGGKGGNVQNIGGGMTKAKARGLSPPIGGQTIV